MTVTLTAPDAVDLEWVVQAHRAHYEGREGFDPTFSPLVAQILHDFSRRDHPRERGWILWRDGMRFGCIFCMQLDAQSAQLRLFYLDAALRGCGLGRLLLETCMDHARAQGFAQMRLWTHESHTAACALYARAGFACEASRPVHHYGCDLVEQVWARDL